MTRAEGWIPDSRRNFDSRRDKARKIVELVGSWRDLRGSRVLDIGTGAGVAAAAMAEAVGPQGRVTGVDVQDLRLGPDGYDFQLVEGVSLPFPENSFDVAVSNQVIEHVGPRHDQLRHLQEIRRVLSDDGVVYLALPNRWAPVEPHFRVPMLTWLPQRLRTPVLRFTGRAGVYDCFPLSHSQATALFRQAGFGYTEHTYEAMRVMRQVERTSRFTRVLLAMPRWLFGALHPFVPTLIFRLRPVAHR